MTGDRDKNNISSEKKEKNLRALVKSLNSAIVAFSGGVDSTYLAYICNEELNENALALTALSSTYPSRQEREAREVAEEIGINHRFFQSEELDNPEFKENPPDRCYYCKIELFQKLKNIAIEEGYNAVLDGTNYDDLTDHRPGLEAAKELKVRSPLLEAEITKEEIRELSRDANLPTWDKPSYACLSSRFPYGSEINSEKLKQVDKGEEFLRNQGFKQFRVRHHGETVRIEISPDELPEALNMKTAGKFVNFFKEIGFSYVTLDLEGYRTGSMNEPLSEDEL